MNGVSIGTSGWTSEGKGRTGVTTASITFGATEEGTERMMLEHGPSQLRRHKYALELDLIGTVA